MNTANAELGTRSAEITCATPETYRVPVGREVVRVTLTAYQLDQGKQRWQFEFFNDVGQRLLLVSNCVSLADACEEVVNLKTQVEKGGI